MSQIRKLIFAPVALAVLSCGGTDEPSIASVSGLWTATRLEYVSVADPAVKVDVIAAGGTATIDLNDNGMYTAVITPPGAAPETTTGTWSYTADTFTLVETGSSGNMTFDMSLGNDAMTLTGADTEFDFNDDGTDEPAKLNISLVR
jgi:hypothetical protein